MMPAKGTLWQTRRAWGTPEDIEEFRRTVAQENGPASHEESVRAFRQAIEDEFTMAHHVS